MNITYAKINIVMEKGILLVLCILVIIIKSKNCQQGTFYSLELSNRKDNTSVLCADYDV